ncbi:MAG: DUF2459 domain-containing protein [Marinobacter sp.]|nr:DUF2459 domain-containing protein [Marinobacter sp.]
MPVSVNGRLLFWCLVAAAMLLFSTSPRVQGEVLIRVERDRLHTAFVLPVSELAREVPELARFANPGSDGLRFGWGDGRYFGVDDRGTSTALMALFLPTHSVMEVSQVRGARSYYEESHPLKVSNAQFSVIAQFIADTFVSLEAEPEALRARGQRTHYYPANRRYHILYTCNNWTAEALYRAGLRSGYRRAWLAGSVMKRLPEAAAEDQDYAGAAQPAPAPL